MCSTKMISVDPATQSAYPKIDGMHRTKANTRGVEVPDQYQSALGGMMVHTQFNRFVETYTTKKKKSINNWAK